MSTVGAPPTSAGWYPDPAGGGRLRFHDGIGWTAQVSHGHGQTRPATPLGQGFARLSDWLSRFLAAYAVVCVVLTAYCLWGMTLADRAVAAPGFDLTAEQLQVPADLRADLESFVNVGLAIMLLSSLVSLVAGVLWLVWQHKLAASAPTVLRRSPGMHVGSWFIPVANWWFPFQNISDLWRSYGTGRQETQAEAAPMLIPLWWASYLLLPFLSGVGGVLAGSSLDPTAPEQLLPRLALVYAVTSALFGGVTLMARQVVRRLSWRALVHHAGNA